jgi:hypothetical protein
LRQLVLDDIDEPGPGAPGSLLSVAARLSMRGALALGTSLCILRALIRHFKRAFDHQKLRRIGACRAKQVAMRSTT